MALVQEGFTAVIIVVDAGGNKSRLVPKIVAADHATALTNVQTIVGHLDALTDGLIKSYSVSENWVEDTAQWGAAGSEVERRAEVSCPLEAPGKEHTFIIPAPVEAMFVGSTGPDRNKVNTSYAPLLAFIENFTDETGYSGTPGPDAIALVSDGEKISPDNDNDKPFVNSGKRTHRGSRDG